MIFCFHFSKTLNFINVSVWNVRDSYKWHYRPISASSDVTSCSRQYRHGDHDDSECITSVPKCKCNLTVR